MSVLTIVLSAAGLMMMLPMAVEAKTTRTFSGSNRAEVVKNARNAGYSYPEGAMKCSPRCSQRWAKD